MRIVLDTNVLVSGIFFSGPPSRILEAWSDGKLELLVTLPILEEYGRVVAILEGRYPGIGARAVLDLIAIHSELHATIDLRATPCEDPDDVKFLACAVTAGADCIVSGDAHLLRISGYHGVRVLTPRRFVEDHL